MPDSTAAHPDSGKSSRKRRRTPLDFFASDPFLTALAVEHYGARQFEVKKYRISGRSVRLASINGRPVVSGPFMDYVRPLQRMDPYAEGIRFIPKLLTKTIALDDVNPAASIPACPQEPAPLVDWRRFTRWEDYEGLIKGRSKNLLSNQNKRSRKLEAEYGPLSFYFADHDPSALEQLVAWKVAQYPGGHAVLEDPRALRMLHRLAADGHLILSSLRIGQKYVAIKAGFVWERQYLSLIPAYDPAFSNYAPGKDLLLRTMRHSFEKGDTSFDLLQGSESYKFDFATHLQIIESVGTPPVSQRIRAAIYGTSTMLRTRSPHIHQALKRLVINSRRITDRG